VDVDLMTLPEVLALVGVVDPGDAFGEHRLAGAVVTAERGHLTGRKLEVDVVQRLDGAEMLVQPP